jgi:hypothetical protein
MPRTTATRGVPLGTHAPKPSCKKFASATGTLKAMPRIAGLRPTKPLLLLPLISLFLFSLPGSAHAAATLTYLQSASDPANSGTHTFSSENFGTPADDRVLIAVVRGNPSAPGDETINSVTIGGVAATIHVQTFDPDQGNNIAIASAPVPSGTSGTIVVTFSGTNNPCRISLYAAAGIGTGATHFSTATDLDDPLSMAINVPQGGVLVAGAQFQNSGAVTAVGVTEDDDTSAGIEFVAGHSWRCRGRRGQLGTG